MIQQMPKEAGMYKQIETDFNCGFGNLVHLTVFRSSGLLMATTDMMSWRHSITGISPEPGSAEGEKGEKWGQKGKISAKKSEPIFSPFPPHCRAWSQAKLASINKMNSPAVSLPLTLDIEK